MVSQSLTALSCSVTIPHMTVRISLSILLTCLCAFGQIPSSAHTDLYFPQLADGGDAAQQWQTTFTFVNPCLSEARVRLFLFDNDGKPLAMDLGNGLAADHTFTVPAGGSRVLRSKIASSAIQVGWAIARSSVPLQATVAFRVLENGDARQEITSQPTLPTLVYTSFANRDLGVAIANAWSDMPVRVNVVLLDKDGVFVGQRQFSLPPLGHTSFNLMQYFPDLPDDFYGVLQITSANPPQEDFVAWTLNADRGMISALPPGAAEWPVSHWERIRLVYRRIIDTALRLGVLRYEPELIISNAPVINAFAWKGDLILINVALSELISDSPSELAFAIAHEVGHIIQWQLNDQSDDPTNPEFDADIKGTMLALLAGYDPYAAAGTLAKLSMASGRAGLITQFGEQLAPDAHKSFNTRLERLYDTLVAVCSEPTVQDACKAYKSVVHPHLPPAAPLKAGSRLK